jgi:hypothetical protein
MSTRLSEQERKSNIRKQNAAYLERKKSHMTESERREKEYELKQKSEMREKRNAGEWVVAGKKVEPVKETDEPVVFRRTKIDWASEMDD